ncbi:MAG: hypothetical protein HRU20_30100 [Pseudomonadales bacterium]|nr:hypothetical protein [Pseudomonadales bacterium]
MVIVGYILALAGLFLLYENQLVIGAVIFFVGGFLAEKLYLSIRSAGVMILAVSIAWAYQNELSGIILFLILVGFVLACFNSKRTNGSAGWGFDIDFTSIGSGSNDGGGGDCGGGD